ncbi:MAG: hypothetical protein WA359_11860 [Acidimicrobiales bacterium]
MGRDLCFSVNPSSENVRQDRDAKTHCRVREVIASASNIVNCGIRVATVKKEDSRAINQATERRYCGQYFKPDQIAGAETRTAVPTNDPAQKKNSKEQRDPLAVPVIRRPYKAVAEYLAVMEHLAYGRLVVRDNSSDDADEHPERSDSE